RRARGERRHHIVRLVAVDRDDGNVERVENLAHALERAVEILLQLLAQLLARRLVLRVFGRAERHAAVVHPADVFRLVVLVQPQQEIRDAPDRRGVLAALGGEGAGDHREEGAIDQRVAVHQEDVGLAGGRGWDWWSGARRHWSKTKPRDQGGSRGSERQR